MTLILDTGALIAVERGDKHVAALIKRERLAGRVPLSHGGVVGQAWRDGSRQARVARLLAGIRVASIDEQLGRRAGELLRRNATGDVIDAAVVLLAVDGDEIITSDPADLRSLAESANLIVDLLIV